jgi:hypothetical protein
MTDMGAKRLTYTGRKLPDRFRVRDQEKRTSG